MLDGVIGCVVLGDDATGSCCAVVLDDDATVATVVVGSEGLQQPLLVLH